MKTINLMFSIIAGLLLFTSCSNNFLQATFEADTIGNSPDITLPGDPVGDQIKYHEDIASRIEVATYPSSTRKALKYENSPISNSNLSGHNAWVSFRGKSANFTNVVQFSWLMSPSISSSGKLTIDMSDGNAHTIGRLEFTSDGKIMVVTGWSPGQEQEIGTFTNGESITVVANVNLNTPNYSLSILKNSGTINRPNNSLIVSTITSYTNPANPSVGFLLGGSSSNKVYIDRVRIGNSAN